MTSMESSQLAKRVNESAKISPLKVVSPIIKKYSEHRQGKIKKKLKFSRILLGGRTKQKSQIKPQLKTILPKTCAGDVIKLEPELLPCALQIRKKKNENEISDKNFNEQSINAKASENSPNRELFNKTSKPKLLSGNKKRIKCLKNIEASLGLLDFNNTALKEKREQAFAENYLLRVQQKLKEKNENLYNQFVDLICNFQSNGITVCDLYKKIKTLFQSHSDLSEDFVAFLTPKQAVECGVFMEHLLLTTMSDFLNMIEVYFSKSPQQIKKIHSVLESLATKPNLTTENVTNAILPLLKGNSVLRDYFLQVLPNGRPPDNFLTDFEEVDYPEMNSDISDDEEIMETVHLPEVDDPFGGDFCPCKCHSEENEKFQNQLDHCLSCSMKFINGKIFIQHGKLLKPAKVVFDEHDMNYHRERLAPKLYPNRGRKRSRHSAFKDNMSPTKSCNLSSDEFKSDIEEDEKGRLRFISSRSPKPITKKIVSPKHCEKTQPKTSLYEFKNEATNGEEKFPFVRCLDSSFTVEEGKSVDNSKIETNQNTKSDISVFQKFLNSSEKNEKNSKETSSLAVSLDLPKIDSACSSELFADLKLLEPEEKSESVGISRDIKIEDCKKPVVLEKEESTSPPVISIPETATLLFSDEKPIFSFLEITDNLRDSPVNFNNPEESFIKKISTSNIESSNTDSEKNDPPWKIEEDRVILQTLQVEENCEKTFIKIGQNIPGRSVDGIKKRFAELMNMFYEMKAKTSNLH